MKRMMKPHDPRQREERERFRRIPFAGKILMLIGALLGHGSSADDRVRETLFIVALIAGAILSCIGLYLEVRGQKKE